MALCMYACRHFYSYLKSQVLLNFNTEASQWLHLSVLTGPRAYSGLAPVYTLHVDVWEQRASERARV